MEVMAHYHVHGSQPFGPYHELYKFSLHLKPCFHTITMFMSHLSHTSYTDCLHRSLWFDYPNKFCEQYKLCCATVIKQLFNSSLLGPQACCQMPSVHVLGVTTKYTFIQKRSNFSPNTSPKITAHYVRYFKCIHLFGGKKCII